MKSTLLGAVLALFAVAPAKDAPAPLTASAPWTVHAEDNLCALSRKFGTGDAEVEIAFQPIFTSESMEVLIVSRDRSSDQRIGQAKLRFAPSGTPLKASYFSVPTKTSGQRYTRVTVNREAFDLTQSSAEMSISAPPLSLTIRVPPTAKAVATFRECEADLLRSWKIDPAAVTPERAAKPLNAGRAFSSDNYPPEAQNKGYVGRVVALVQVDAAGKPTACRIVSGVAASLNDATCKGAMRVQFQPGTDAEGRPAASVTVIPVRWQQ